MKLAQTCSNDLSSALQLPGSLSRDSCLLQTICHMHTQVHGVLWHHTDFNYQTALQSVWEAKATMLMHLHMLTVQPNADLKCLRRKLLWPFSQQKVDEEAVNTRCVCSKCVCMLLIAAKWLITEKSCDSGWGPEWIWIWSSFYTEMWQECHTETTAGLRFRGKPFHHAVKRITDQLSGVLIWSHSQLWNSLYVCFVSNLIQCEIILGREAPLQRLIYENYGQT